MPVAIMTVVEGVGEAAAVEVEVEVEVVACLVDACDCVCAPGVDSLATSEDRFSSSAWSSTSPEASCSRRAWTRAWLGHEGLWQGRAGAS
jgi:hypothetical protein